MIQRYNKTQIKFLRAASNRGVLFTYGISLLFILGPCKCLAMSHFLFCEQEVKAKAQVSNTTSSCFTYDHNSEKMAIICNNPKNSEIIK
jgi:hypothetical protein